MARGHRRRVRAGRTHRAPDRASWSLVALVIQFGWQSASRAIGGNASRHGHTPTFQQVPYETPRALDAAELPALVASFRQAAMNAIETTR